MGLGFGVDGQVWSKICGGVGFGVWGDLFLGWVLGWCLVLG